MGGQNGSVIAARLTAGLSIVIDIEGDPGDTGGDSSSEEEMLDTARVMRGYRVRGPICEGALGV